MASLLRRATSRVNDRPDSSSVLAPTDRRLSRPVSMVAGSSGPSLGRALGVQGVDALSGSAIAYRCVQAITNPLAALQLGVRRGDELDTEQHPIAQLWNRYPNPSLSAYIVKSIIWQQLELSGEAFVYVDRGETGESEPRELWPIFDPVQVVASKTTPGRIDGYVVTVSGGRKVALLASEVLWLRYPHPTSPYGAIAPWKAALFAAQLDAEARAWQYGELLNGARPEGIFYLGDVDEAVHNATVEAWRSRHVGARNALKHLFVSGPTEATYARVGLTPAEMSYLDSRRHNAEEVMLAFGVHPDLLRGGATFENQRAAKVNLWSETLLPKLHVVDGEVDRQLLPSLEETCEHDVRAVEALRESEDAKSSRARELMYADVLLVDEARELVGLDPLPDRIGANTLTAYRALVTAQAQTLVEPERVSVVQLDTRAELTTRARRRRVLQPDAVLRAYARGEEVGQRAVRRLAAKQARVVARKLRELQRKGTFDALVTRARGCVCPADAVCSCPADRSRFAEQVREQADDLFDRSFMYELTRDALDSFLGGVYDSGAALTARALGISFELFDTQVTLAMQARLDDLAGKITDTTHDIIERELLREGVEQGEGIPKLADRLSAVFDHLAGWRAETIARTETVSGHNSASRTAAVASGEVLRREWVATQDDRTRDSHADLDGYVTNGLDDPYPNGCMYPGDPTGAARETVNCRCVELFLMDES